MQWFFLRPLLALLVAVLIASDASAATQPSYPHPQFKKIWKEASSQVGARVTEFPDFTMVVSSDGLVYYYFTKQNHFAHPGIVKRTARPNNGGWSFTIDGTSFAKKRDDPNFLRWLQEFERLNREMTEEIGRLHRQRP